MRIAIQNPMFMYGNINRNYNGYAVEFARICRPVIYLPGGLNVLSQGALFKHRLSTKSSEFKTDDYEFAFTPADLNRKADILISFNGFPYESGNQPPPRFKGLKVYHVFEYVFHAQKANRFLEEGGVDYVLGYANHGQYCSFFQEFYPRFRDKVIGVPFGFGSRFIAANKNGRIQKVVALGAVNPVNDHTVEDKKALVAYARFHQQTIWTHGWRHLLRENIVSLGDIVDSFLPNPPETNNRAYDAVKMLNRYAMFANDEGLMGFPPARTYEGTAAGSVMVSSDHGSFKDLGFIDGVNCIMHERHNISDFRDKVEYYIENPTKLTLLAANSTQMVQQNYSHARVAKKLLCDVTSLWQGDPRGREPI